MALNIVKGFDLKGMGHLSADALHVQIEAMKIAFADAKEYVADPRMADVPVEGLLSEAYACERRKLVDMRRAAPENLAGTPLPGSDTEYHSVVDRWGNACSFICSNYMGIGSGLVAGDTGIALQNRGALFDLNPQHRNVIAGGKRPYHTIIPAMSVPLGDDKPFRVVSFGVMGGFMQPQGHMQVHCNLADYGLNVQEALDAPRFRVDGGAAVGIEPGVPAAIRDELTARGHALTVSSWWTPAFGRGQVVAVQKEFGGAVAGSEPRSDGCAVGW